ncbi:MAG: hypothetical protein COW85_02650 [Ignavibacteria bacterium CG22_combo_CG10-13_8_21_14_all_37_15]|nr:MAG: hypothetical protein COW85_02650 [Ignavibacteria bacterium CG22_combo_CG10-13_8_21_14_all_37_15]
MSLSANILTYFSVFIWLLPPVRQYKNFLFKYFLILGIADLIGLFFFKILQTPFPDLYIIVSFLLFVALQKNEYLKKKKIIFICLGLMIILISFFRIEKNPYIFLIAFLHLVIIFRILYLFVMVVAQKQTINFFYLVLAFYEFTVLLKFLNFLFPLNVEAQAYFYVTTIFELVVGIFYTTFREDSRKLVYQLK